MLHLHPAADPMMLGIGAQHSQSGCHQRLLLLLPGRLVEVQLEVMVRCGQGGAGLGGQGAGNPGEGGVVGTRQIRGSACCPAIRRGKHRGGGL